MNQTVRFTLSPCRALFLTLALCSAALNSAQAQDGAQGAIRGRVQDSEFYTPIPGADISIEGRNEKVSSEEDGSFFINALPPGVYTLLASRSGYIKERVSDVAVQAGAVAEVQMELLAEVIELDDFVVSTEDIIESASNMTPTALAADMSSFSSALGGDFLSKIAGGGDIGGAVTRLAGTSVVDSRYVVIRGLSDRYNVVVLNNARIPSSDPDRRAVNIDIFPSKLVERVVSSKTFTPDMPGEATGGFLNIVTKSIPDKPFVDIFWEHGYNTQATSNREYIRSDGGGTGFLGTARNRALPGVLRATTFDTLPRSPPTILSPPGEPFPSAMIVENRDKAARLLSSRSLGSNTVRAPWDFAASLSAGTYVDDFFGGRLGIVGALSYSKRYELDQGLRGRGIITIGADGLSRGELTRIVSFQEGEEKLLAGALFSIGWQGPERDTITFTYFTNVAADDESTFGIGNDVSFGGDPVIEQFNPKTADLMLLNEVQYYTERKLSTFQLTGEHLFSDDGDIKIDWAAAYSSSSQDEPDIRFANYSYSRSANVFGTLSNDFSGPRFERIWRRLDDQNYNLNLNIEMPIGRSADGKELAKIKYGGALDYSDREYRTDNFTYIFNPVPTIPFQTPPTGRTPTANNRQMRTIADQIAARDVDPSNPGNPTVDSTFLSRTDTPPGIEAYTASQNIAALYTMATFNLSPDLEVMFGGRLETTDIRASVGSNFDALDPFAGGFIFNDLITGEPIPINEILNPSLQATDLLPAFAASWDFAEKMTLRAAVSRTIARPTFKEIAPVLARDPATGDFFVGNVRIQRSDIINYDMRAEWFPNPDDFVILSAFSKYIRAPIEAINFGSIGSVFNEEAATIYGFEIEFGKKLTEWGPLLRDTTLGFNYAKMISQVQLSELTSFQRSIVNLPTSRSLQGQPDYTMNFNAIYDNEDFGFSIGAFLNITGEVLYQVGGLSGSQAIPDVFQETYTRLDFNISKKIYDDWFLALRIGNFLNTERRRVFRIGNEQVGPLEYVREGTIYAISLSRQW